MIIKNYLLKNRFKRKKPRSATFSKDSITIEYSNVGMQGFGFKFYINNVTIIME